MMPKVYVSRGRTVCDENGEHGPGTLIDLSPDQVSKLKALGFVQDTPPVLYAAVTEPNPAGVGNQGAFTQGPQFRK
jgi:hypothetical protein